ncbi:hypothetical protein A9A59_0389 [Tepidiforma thermophila]|uniref:Uncharacterized protein n=1 Tax=Tepidiforma thermophila (strain KCTC 52669 / CGMCC 1.13589 / G233) TaxID=2761530 RepID=A0A2A9HB70_TEPT2|nr:hypothetical protein A9A59_0389 [Tepidiforma thermophila]
MSSARHNQLLELLIAFALGELSLEHFEDQVLPLAWESADGSGPAAELAGDVLLWLAEATQGHRTEAELRRLAAARLRTVVVETEPPVARTGTGTPAAARGGPVVSLSDTQGRRPAAASA